MTGIAVVGQACRFPGAADPAAYWAGLLADGDSIHRAPRADLAGLVPEARLGNPRFVAASGLIDDVFDFDPGRYRISPREAVITDPQHRLFLHVAREALENAGVLPRRAGQIAVFGGVGRNRHEDMVRATLPDPDVEDLTLEIGNEKDYFATKVSYRLGLTGASVVVQSACSTGLLAVHQACLALANYECDVALAGASTVRLPLEYGYVFGPGGIGSPTGFCRPFAAEADGSVPGDGVGCVVLRRLDDALADGDPLLAVIRGSAVNNDGTKDGFASVSAAAQVAVIETALDFAEVTARDIGYVEAHGSGTALGDETEWTALGRVFKDGVVVGSAKSQLGHLREASGMAGLLKTIAVLREGRIPPSLNGGSPARYATNGPGPRLATAAEDWHAAGGGPRRAGVSSFGLGGTNVHLVMEEPPARELPAGSGRAEVLTISAHTAEALRATAERLLAPAGPTAHIPLAAVAATLQHRREHLPHRWAVAAVQPQEWSDELADGPRNTEPAAADGCPTGFVYPGIGDHYAGMTEGLTDYLPGFRDLLTRALDEAGEVAGRDFHRALSPGPAAKGGRGTGASVDLRAMVRGTPGGAALSDPVNAHVVTFCVQTALTTALAGVGVVPAAVMGHSLGELVAATVAGVFEPRDAYRVLVRRAQLVAAQPEGGMLAVSLPADDTAELTGPGVWLSTVNTPNSCVLGGERPALAAVAARLARRGVQTRAMPVSHAFHTPMLHEAAEELRELLASLTLRPPSIPMVTGVTADWVGSEITRPQFWARQLSSTVHFGAGVVRLSDRCAALLEVGPGQLRSIAHQSGIVKPGTVALATVRRRYEVARDDVFLARALGRLWERGADIDWAALRGTPAAPGVPLPPNACDDRPFRAGSGLLGARPRTAGDDAQGAVGGSGHESSGRPATGPAPLPSDSCGTPPPGTRELLAGIWRDVLGVADVDPADHFFDLGGDSLMGVRLIAMLESSLGAAVPAKVVFESAVLSRMAAAVQRWLETRQDPG
ncbi:beta-ketoacyl synthase N-terminal-like domain-containing protein [Streptomyces sp. SL13]|uniref:Beta-ketoacyl synthase N-terminal-like domain-containing protein n=1 Tax=Streptantibioticus silvisoli TaxID=2705255 RepID=A0AA90KJ58_9ACTN|nr:beta-ketoacyl synthase N-terminal-like domain-containing protein [Streptantibioticus silvisoli]MDI5973319.1 beta-ketoacyl synthase N-terminal-like domain-containing protein [Streptantibioticus silvisoli]